MLGAINLIFISFVITISVNDLKLTECALQRTEMATPSPMETVPLKKSTPYGG